MVGVGLGAIRQNPVGSLFTRRVRRHAHPRSYEQIPCVAGRSDKRGAVQRSSRDHPRKYARKSKANHKVRAFDPERDAECRSS